MKEGKWRGSRNTKLHSIKSSKLSHAACITKLKKKKVVVNHNCMVCVDMANLLAHARSPIGYVTQAING